MNDSHLFKAAREVSKKADYTGGNNIVKIGCVVAYKGTILAKGCNTDRTHTKQALYNRYRYDYKGNRYVPDKSHAELIAVNKIRYLDIDFSKVHVYVYREYRGSGMLANCRPCAACENYMRSLGIKHIHYTDESGYCHLKLV